MKVQVRRCGGCIPSALLPSSPRRTRSCRQGSRARLHQLQMHSYAIHSRGQECRAAGRPIFTRVVHACSRSTRRRRPLPARLPAPSRQYPGVSRSIVSDINNVMRLISVANLLPKGLYVENAGAVAGWVAGWRAVHLYRAWGEACPRGARSPAPRRLAHPPSCPAPSTHGCSQGGQARAAPRVRLPIRAAEPAALQGARGWGRLHVAGTKETSGGWQSVAGPPAAVAAAAAATSHASSFPLDLTPQHFHVPEPIPELSTEQVLTSERVPGVHIDKVRGAA